ncbi:hypothetical protein BGW38_000650 [Lunasporangiospora selenospora]|uniref:Wax synthase domain-containing protein n=1 Tax=Lunasporangiospora selenospora TaxID=979761 RepID=A0A9P6FWR4_9FUNG|nr:hypothetical protein BGW38_000650 [Lunasporangiospora selenospora]
MDRVSNLLAPVASSLGSKLNNALSNVDVDGFLARLPPSLPVTPCSPASDPSRIQLPNSLYFSIFFIFGGGLYAFLLFPLPLRVKQLLAAPLVFGLFALPLIMTAVNSPALQFIHVSACSCVLMRMFDLYYITPWRTGKEPVLNLEDWYCEVWAPFRKVPLSKDQLERQEVERQRIRLLREAAKSLENASDATSTASPNNTNEPINENKNETRNDSNNDQNEIKEASEPSTLRKRNVASSEKDPKETVPGKPVQEHTLSQPIDPNPQHWSYYLPRWFFYFFLMDAVPFSLSFLTFEQIQTFSLVPSLLVKIGVSALIIFDISFANYTIMIIWAALSGNLIHDTEWTLVRHYFPGLATSPSEFWRQWHHLFRYIWVDLGFKPTHHIFRKYVTRGRKVKSPVLKALEKILPIMGVFFMSGLMHEYIVIGMWHARFGPMTAFFLIQGAGTIISKAVYDSVGHKVHVPSWILIALTWAFNLTTAGLFMEPVIKNNGFNIIANQSILLHSYNLMRSLGVF